MKQNKFAAKFQPIVDDETKIEVSLQAEEAVIKLSTWHNDLGWTVQKTLAFDTAMLDNLHRAVAAARYKINSLRSDDKNTDSSSKLLKFPTVLR